MTSHDVFLGLGQTNQSLTEDELRQIFCHFGEILEVNIKQISKSAYIRFVKKKSADLAVRQGENYVRHIRKDIGKIKIGWANVPIVNHAIINNESSSDSDSSITNEVFDKLDAAYKCMTDTSWTCPDPGCRHINNLDQEHCSKCKFRRDFPVARSKQMLGKSSPVNNNSCQKSKELLIQEKKEKSVIKPSLNEIPKETFKVNYDDKQIAELRQYDVLNITPEPNKRHKENVESRNNIDKQMAELQRCCSSLISNRGKTSKETPIKKDNLGLMELVSIFENELTIRNNNGYITAEPTCDSVRKAYNFYVQCKEMFEKEPEPTSRKNKKLLLDISVKELAHKLRSRLYNFPIENVQKHKENIDSFLEKHPSEYKQSLNDRKNKDRIYIPSDDIERKISNIKQSLSDNNNDAWENIDEIRNLTNESIAAFARSLREVAACFDAFAVQEKAGSECLWHMLKLPNLGKLLKKAIYCSQNEEAVLPTTSTKIASDVNTEIEVVVQLQEDQQQSCRLYLAHKLMATEIQKRHPDAKILDSITLASKFKEVETAPYQMHPSEHSAEIKLDQEIPHIENSIAQGICALDAEDQEVESIFTCNDKLMDRSWISNSNEDRKEKLKRLQNMFTPCIMKKSTDIHNESITSKKKVMN